MGREQWETPEEQAIRRKNRLRLAVVGPIAILIVAIAVIAYVRNPEDTDSAATAAPAFVGAWQGAADNGRETFDVVLTINGEGSEQAATSSHTNTATGARCDRVERVVSASETELTLTAESVTGTDCDKGAQSTIQLHTDGSLAYRTGAVGSIINGVLHKV